MSNTIASILMQYQTEYCTAKCYLTKIALRKQKLEILIYVFIDDSMGLIGFSSIQNYI